MITVENFINITVNLYGSLHYSNKSNKSVIEIKKNVCNMHYKYIIHYIINYFIVLYWI